MARKPKPADDPDHGVGDEVILRGDVTLIRKNASGAWEVTAQLQGCSQSRIMVLLALRAVVLFVVLTILDLALIGLGIAVVLGVGLVIWMAGGAEAVGGLVFLGAAAWLVAGIYKRRAPIAARISSIRREGLLLLPGDKIIIAGAVVFAAVMVISPPTRAATAEGCIAIGGIGSVQCVAVTNGIAEARQRWGQRQPGSCA